MQHYKETILIYFWFQPQPLVSVRIRPVPEIIDPVFAKTSQNARFLLSENDRFGLVFVKTGSINSGTGSQARAGIFKQSVGARNREGIGLSY
jgi:hypothetical protein